MAGEMWLSDDDQAPPEPAEKPASWRRWAPLAAVFALGVAVALVVADARRDAAGSASIELLAGGTSLGDIDDVSGSRSVDFYLINTGVQDVEIVSVEAEGFAADTEADEPLSVTAEPGEWVSFVTDVVADCDVRPSGDIRVNVRGGAGQETVHAELTPGASDDAISFWGMSCRSLREVALDVELVSADIGPQLTTVFSVTQFSGRASVDLEKIESRTPGVSLMVPEDVLPVPIHNEGPPTKIAVQWRVDSCEPAMAMTAVAMEALITAPGGGGERVDINADTALSVELARLSERVCET